MLFQTGIAAWPSSCPPAVYADSTGPACPAEYKQIWLSCGCYMPGHRGADSEANKHTSLCPVSSSVLCLSLFIILPSAFSLCTSTSCSDYTFPSLLCHSFCSYFLFSTTLFTIPSSRPFCQREAIAAITRNMPEWRDTLLQTERDSPLSLYK